eukprot:1256663-Amphidinium_carterae.1
MDEFSTSMNDCIKQLTVELQQAESSTGMVVTKLKAAMEVREKLRTPKEEIPKLQREKQKLEAENEILAKERQLMYQQMTACQTAVQNIRNEACLFRDKMI